MATLKATDKFLAIGLMSGTSLDGIDAALIETDGQDYVHFIGSTYVEYPEDMRRELSAAARLDIPFKSYLRLEKKLTELHAEAVQDLLEHTETDAKDIAVIGFHGQTVRHMPEEGITCQMGDVNRLFVLTGIAVAGDFRRADMAAGGQGAPLAALYHKALFKKVQKPTLIVNIGGVSNGTWLGSGDAILAGDFGPGCGLLDSHAQKHLNAAYDKDDKMALSGQVNESVLAQNMAKLSFLKEPLPKSADRYDFAGVDVSMLSPADGAATLSALTVESLKESLKLLPLEPKSVWVTGGGVYHPLMMRMLKERLPEVNSVEELGLRPDILEAECFAWLAVRRLKNLPITLPETTACQKQTIGGILTACK